MIVFIIIGPQAVGKMTVGQELEKRTGAHLFYNHMTIDLVEQFFPYGSPQGDYLVKEYRRLLFKAVSNTYDYSGFIFTFLCDFDSCDGKPFLLETYNLFADKGHTVYLIELYADYHRRKKRNLSIRRLWFKKSKRSIPKSMAIYEHFEKVLRATSAPGEITCPNYLRINNSRLSPKRVVDIILEHITPT